MAFLLYHMVFDYLQIHTIDGFKFAGEVEVQCQITSNLPIILYVEWNVLVA